MTLCYIDNGIKERIIRQQYLASEFYFNCLCPRCLGQIGLEKEELKIKQDF